MMPNLTPTKHDKLGNGRILCLLYTTENKIFMTRSTEAPLTSLKHLRKVSGRVCIVLVCIYVKKNNVVF